MSDPSEHPNGKLSIVGTPIGNLGDLTFRALWNMKECDAIYAEDTRVIGKLLAHYGLRTSVFRLDAATEGKKAGEVEERLARSEHIVYVSDAGTPGISDPGARLVAHIREALPECIIEAIPGPSSVTAALSIAGISGDAFTFLGFLPHKKGRQSAVKTIAQSPYPVVLFESPHRIGKLLAELEAAGVQRVGIGRELTKLHEEFVSGDPASVAQRLKIRKAERGEFVVIALPAA